MNRQLVTGMMSSSPTLRTGSRKILKTFNVCDYMMVQNYPKQLPSGTVKMLHVCSVGPFKILNKLNCNIYVINLPRDYGISCIFNVYKSFHCSSLVVKPSPKPFSKRPPLTPLRYPSHYSREG